MAPAPGNKRRTRRGVRKHRPASRVGHRTGDVVAAVDLGTNNCRLLIASPGPNGEFRIVDSFSRIVRLGEGLGASGELSPAAIDRTVAALKVCAGRIAKSGAIRVRAIATHAARHARNGNVLVARAAAEAGLTLEIVSAEEEARLAAVGCAPLIGRRYEGALIFDVGGGSTEVIWMRRENGTNRMIHAASVPVGVVSVAERFRDLPQDRAYYETVRGEMTALFLPVREAMAVFDVATHHLLGTSGTVTTLAGIALGLDRYIRAKVDATWHHCGDILAVIDRIVALDHAGRAALGCVGTERADLIVPGCAIFGGIYANWPCADMRVADRGLREGILRELAEARG